jgi:hypothetical protein
MPVVRVKELRDADGTNPYPLDAALIFGGLPEEVTLQTTPLLFRHGEDYQSSTPKGSAFSMQAQLLRGSYTELRAALDELDFQLGLRNKRLYINDDRFWLVRAQGLRLNFPHRSVRLFYLELEVSLRAMDPRLYDNDGVTYHWWW